VALKKSIKTIDNGPSKKKTKIARIEWTVVGTCKLYILFIYNVKGGMRLEDEPF
jgi:hypothetical protein